MSQPGHRQLENSFLWVEFVRECCPNSDSDSFIELLNSILSIAHLELCNHENRIRSFWLLHINISPSFGNVNNSFSRNTNKIPMSASLSIVYTIHIPLTSCIFCCINNVKETQNDLTLCYFRFTLNCFVYKLCSSHKCIQSKYDSPVMSEVTKMGKHKWNRPEFCMRT